MIRRRIGCRRRSMVLHLSCVLVLFGLVAFGQSLAYAGNPSSCVTGRSAVGFKPAGSHYFDGVDATSHGSEVDGVKSTILDYAPNVPTSTGGFSAVWVMLKQRIPCQYAQIGYVENFGNTRSVFNEYTKVNNTIGCSRYLQSCTNCVVQNFQGLGDHFGTNHTFRVEFGACTTSDCLSSDQNEFIFYHDGLPFDDYPVNNTANGNWFVPDLAEIRGETSDYSIQMPGDTSTHETFTANQLKVAGSWIDFGQKYWNPSYAGSAFGNTTSSSTSFEIWDKQCP